MDVQQSDIDNLEERVKKLSYQTYLPVLRMSNVRSFNRQTINFDFPVTAIIGTNGGGKSTVLGAAALAYKSIKPGDFFPSLILVTIAWRTGGLIMRSSIAP